MSGTRIYLADDHPVVLDGLAKILSAYPELEIAGVFDDGVPLLSAMYSSPVDLIITDLQMKAMDGIELCHAIRKNFPATRVLVLTMYKESHFHQKLIGIGANGCILKSSNAQEILLAIHSIMRGETFFPDYINVNNEQITSTTISSGITRSLTNREEQVLKCIAEGKSSVEIAEILCISEHTAKTHRKNIQGKLNLHKTSQLVTFAIEQGFLKKY